MHIASPVSSRRPSEAFDSVDLEVELNPKEGGTMQIDMLEKEVEGASHVRGDDTSSTSVDLEVELNPKEGGAMQIDMLEREVDTVSNSNVQGFVRIQLGLGHSTPSRTLNIQKKEEQETLNRALQQLLDIIQTKDFIDVWVGHNGDGCPCLHTLTVYRKVGDEIEPEHYNLIVPNEWTRLLTENMAMRGEECSREMAEQHLAGHRQSLKEIAKDLSCTIQQVGSHIVESMYSNDSICPINGEDPFAGMSLRISKMLQDPNFMKRSVPSMLSNPNYKMVDPSGQLNARGSRALKEALAVHYLIEYEKEYVSNRLSFLRSHSCSDLIERRERTRILREINMLARRAREIEQYSKAACMIGMIQIHREVSLITRQAAAGDASCAQEVQPISLRDALIKADQGEGRASLDSGVQIEGIYRLNKRNIDAYKRRNTAEDGTVKLVKGNGSEQIVSRADFLDIVADQHKASSYRLFSVVERDLLDPVAMRKRLSLKVAQEFQDLVVEQNRRWYQTEPDSKSWFNFRNVQPISTEEEHVGFELGNILFYKGITEADALNPSFRIINQLRHQDREIPLSREIGGINAVIPAASQLVQCIDETSMSESENTGLGHFAKPVVAKALKSLRQLGEFEGQLPHQAIQSVFNGK